VLSHPLNHAVWACVVVLGLTPFAAADDTKTTTKPPPDPPGTGPIMTQLRSWFDQHDLNSDGFLDKEELAKAFRGANAKPFDATDNKDAPKDPPKDPPADTTKDTSTDSTKDSTKPTTSKYAKYIDYQFLTLLDTNEDAQISREEFDTWARGYAVQLKQLEELNVKILRMEQELAKKMNAEMHRELQLLQQQQRRLMAQQAHYQQHFYPHR
jgi:Ca2+-binding EF-hand superfamily protein